MTGFAEKTKAERQGDDTIIELPEEWVTPWGLINGGFSAAVTLRSAMMVSSLMVPASFAAHFIRPVPPGPVSLASDVFWHGGRTEAIRTRMEADGAEVVNAVVWMVEMAEGIEHDFAPPPHGPGPDELEPLETLLAAEGLPLLPIWQQFEVRPRNWVPFSAPQPRPPVECSWLRVRDPGGPAAAETTAAAILVLMDLMMALPILHPQGVAVADSRYFPMSLDLSAQFFRLEQATPWLLVEAAAPVAAGGLVGGRASVWSERGQLLAFGMSQLICRRQPPSPDL